LIICPACGSCVQADLCLGCPSCGARAVGPPLARAEHGLPSFGRAGIAFAGGLVMVGFVLFAAGIAGVAAVATASSTSATFILPLAVAGVFVVSVPSGLFAAALGGGDGSVVTGIHLQRARVAGAGPAGGLAVWAGGGRLAGGRGHRGPAGRMSRRRGWQRADRMPDQGGTHGNGQHHGDEPRDRSRGQDRAVMSPPTGSTTTSTSRT